MTKFFVVSYYLIFSVLFAFTIPVLEGPDEHAHLDYINFVGRHSRAPVLNEVDSNGTRVLLAHHPPLYYILASVLIRLVNEHNTIDVQRKFNRKHVWFGGTSRNVPVHMHLMPSIFPTDGDRTAFYLLRILSVLMGLVTVICVMKLTPLMFPEHPGNMFPAFLVASLPQFTFISAMITNDNLVTMFSTLSIYYLTSILDDPGDWKKFACLGVLFGLAILTKKTAIVSSSGYSRDIVLHFHSQSRNVFPFVQAYSALQHCDYICRWIRFYSELYSMRVHSRLWSGNEVDSVADTAEELVSEYFAHQFIPGLSWTFVADLGYTGLGVPEPVYVFYLALITLSLAGLAVYMVRQRLGDVKVNIMLLLLGSAVAGAVIYNLTFSQPHGRFLFPVISSIAILITLGHNVILLDAAPEKIRNTLECGVISCLIVCDMVAILWAHSFYYNLENYLGTNDQ